MTTKLLYGRESRNDKEQATPKLISYFKMSNNVYPVRKTKYHTNATPPIKIILEDNLFKYFLSSESSIKSNYKSSQY